MSQPQECLCVIRRVAGLDQYIPLEDAVAVDPNERVFSGLFRFETQKDGPSGSHLRTICLPAGPLASEQAGLCVLPR